MIDGTFPPEIVAVMTAAFVMIIAFYAVAFSE